jgi:hypothetical protein
MLVPLVAWTPLAEQCAGRKLDNLELVPKAPFPRALVLHLNLHFSKMAGIPTKCGFKCGIKSPEDSRRDKL